MDHHSEWCGESELFIVPDSQGDMVIGIDEWFCGGIPRDLGERLARCPHLVMSYKGRVFKEIGEVTDCRPAPWRLTPMYDDEGRFIYEDKPPFGAWKNPHNQKALMTDDYGQRGRPCCQDTQVIIDSALDETLLQRLFPIRPCPGHVAYPVSGSPDRLLPKPVFRIRPSDYMLYLPSAAQNLEIIGWFAFPDMGDEQYLFFACSPVHRAWIDHLKERLEPLGLLPRKPDVRETK